ncbi:hypothetical protein T484DRAFT_1902670, partial [Baffinella frigidus]
MTSFSAKGKSASSSRLLSMPVMRGWGGGGEDKMSAEDKTRLEALIDSSEEDAHVRSRAASPTERSATLKHGTLDAAQQGAWARAQPVACAGYLKKGQAKVFGYTKRYYVLRGHVLLYYETEGDAASGGQHQRGLLSLPGAILTVVRGISRHPRGYSEHALRIQAPAKDVTLFPKTGGDLLRWYEALVGVCASTASGGVAEGGEGKEVSRVVEVDQRLAMLYSTPIRTERIQQSARRLGIDLEKESNLAWLAHAASDALSQGGKVLPGDWMQHRDSGTAMLYYYNSLLRVSAWSHPLVDYFEFLTTQLRVHLPSEPSPLPGTTLPPLTTVA